MYKLSAGMILYEKCWHVRKSPKYINITDDFYLAFMSASLYVDFFINTAHFWAQVSQKEKKKSAVYSSVIKSFQNM